MKIDATWPVAQRLNMSVLKRLAIMSLKLISSSSSCVSIVSQSFSRMCIIVINVDKPQPLDLFSKLSLFYVCLREGNGWNILFLHLPIERLSVDQYWWRLSIYKSLKSINIKNLVQKIGQLTLYFRPLCHRVTEDRQSYDSNNGDNSPHIDSVSSATSSAGSF